MAGRACDGLENFKTLANKEQLTFSKLKQK